MIIKKKKWSLQDTEVNAKMAAQDEAKYSKETMNRKHRFVNPQESENHRY